MKHLSLLKHLALACGVAATTALVTSCTGVSLPQTKANQLADSNAVTVYSYNNSSTARTRTCNPAGPLPDNTARALRMWLEKSTVKNFSYAYPQYYMELTNPKTGRTQVWGICSDGQGNLVGLLIPRNGVKAWDLPYVGTYKMYVCDTNERKALSDAIMEELSDRGYDAYRLGAIRATGLTDEQFLISKPLTEAAKARIAAAKAKEEAAAEAREKAKEDAKEEPESTEPAAAKTDDGVEEATPMSEVNDDTDSDDSSSTDDDSSSDDSDDAASDDTDSAAE